MEVTKDLPLFLSVKRASEISGITRWTLYRLCADGTLRSRKIGHLRLIETKSLLALLGLTKEQTNKGAKK